LASKLNAARIRGWKSPYLSRGDRRLTARKHHEVLAHVEAELGLPKSLRRYAKKVQEEE